MDPEAILAAIEQQRESAAELPPQQDRVPYLGYYLGSEVYGLPLDQLREVARVAQVRRVPGAPAGVAGLVNLRGEIVCALDVRAILGLPAKTSNEPPFLVALRGFGDPLGLIVDSIADIYALTADDIEAPPSTWPKDRAACFIGTARVPAGLMGLLDLARITKL
jgi:purine-binding chemotaxis protein CheW